MADLYNLTMLDNSTDLLQMAIATNDLTNDLFIILVLVTLAVILLVGITRREKDFKESFLITSVLMSFVCLITWATGLIEWQVLLISVICVFIGFVVYKFTG